MNELRMSVVIPIYNAEKYINRAVDSILAQSGMELEILLVNDGSRDGSAAICDAYAAKDKRIRVIHKENGGISSARNAGIEAATGSHITFLDADDFVDADAYAKIVEVIKQDNPDCIDFGWKYVNDAQEITENRHGLKKKCVLEREMIENIILPPMLNLKKDDAAFIYDFSWNKIYKKDIVDRYKIYFDEKRRVWEDRVFVVQYLKYCMTFYSMEECFYNYVSVQGSLSRKYDPDFFGIIIENYNTYKNLFGEKYNFEIPYVWSYWCHSIENMIFRSLREENNQIVIQNNILDTLKNEQVIEWYCKREPKNEFEKQLSILVKSGEIEQALAMYKEKVKKDKKQEKKGQLKSVLRKILKGGL